MSEFIVKQGDTISINYQIPDIDLTSKKVFFCWGDRKKYSKRVECKRQSVTSKNYIMSSAGGLSIPFKGEDLDRPGSFDSQFEIFNRNDEKVTYPQIGYFKIEVQQAV